MTIWEVALVELKLIMKLIQNNYTSRIREKLKT